WDALKANQKTDRLAFWKENAEQRKQLRVAIRDEVKREFNPDWQAYALQRDARKLDAARFNQDIRHGLRQAHRRGAKSAPESMWRQLHDRQEAYHQQMRADLLMQRMAITARMKERFAALAAPALEKLSQDRAHIYSQHLKEQGSERQQLHR